MTILIDPSIKHKILEILGENPTIPYSIIGRKVGVTRERVRQIARQNGYPPRRHQGKLNLKTCSTCSKTYVGGNSAQTCPHGRQGKLKSKKCPVCNKVLHSRGLYCSAECGSKAFFVCHSRLRRTSQHKLVPNVQTEPSKIAIMIDEDN